MPVYVSAVRDDACRLCLCLCRRSEHYSSLSRRDTDLTTYADGEMVAAPWLNDCWYRARVIDSDVHERIEDSRVLVNAG